MNWENIKSCFLINGGGEEGNGEKGLHTGMVENLPLVQFLHIHTLAPSSSKEFAIVQK